jgi:hypothetical protein
MRQREIPAEFVAAIKAIAAEKGLGLAYNTHYDAFNWELRWWFGKSLHCLNFQPWLEERLLISHKIETYPSPARFVHWAQRFVPFFPRVAKIEEIPLDELGRDATRTQFEMRVRELLSTIA